jgi:hypothetical protein
MYVPGMYVQPTLIFVGKARNTRGSAWVGLTNWVVLWTQLGGFRASNFAQDLQILYNHFFLSLMLWQGRLRLHAVSAYYNIYQ